MASTVVLTQRAAKTLKGGVGQVMERMMIWTTKVSQSSHDAAANLSLAHILMISVYQLQAVARQDAGIHFCSLYVCLPALMLGMHSKGSFCVSIHHHVSLEIYATTTGAAGSVFGGDNDAKSEGSNAAFFDEFVRTVSHTGSTDDGDQQGGGMFAAACEGTLHDLPCQHVMQVLVEY